MKIGLKHDLWGRDEAIQLDLPERWNVSVLRMEGDSKSVLQPEAYRNALAPLEAVLKGKKEICILFDDLSRPTRVYRVMPHLIELFEKCGIRDDQVRFLCALGTHVPLDNADFRRKLGEETLERFPVYNHNPYENCEHIGTTKLGTPIMVNKEFLACDFRVGIGSFVPHGFCGYGGGYKLIMPGIAHIDSITYHHRTLRGQNLDFCRLGRYQGNPMLEDLKEFGRTARLDVKIDMLVNSEAEGAEIYAGNPDGSYEAFAEKAASHYNTPVPDKADIVIVNSYAKGNEASIGFSLAEELLRDEGGDVALLADIPGGQVVHYLFGKFGKDTWGRLGGALARNSAKIKRLFVFTQYKDLAGGFWYGKQEDILWQRDLSELVRTLDEGYKDRVPRVHVIPDGTLQTVDFQNRLKWCREQ